MPSPDSTEAGRFCALCGAAIPLGAPCGQCPRCLLSLASGDGEPAFAELDLLDSGQVRSFGDYDLLEEIARGGMGVVYRARQRGLEREVALKMILAGELATAETVRRFRNEAAAAARLDHPHIVSVYEIGEHELQHYFSMRLILGCGNIARWARALTAVGSGRAQAISVMMAKVARAIAFAHERGVLHRDLKPSNVLVDEKGEPQVTDFGLAKLVAEPDGTRTHSASILGSPSYMAPEQADGRHGDITTATDVYGLGAVLYELLTGRPPFCGPSPLATARMVVDQMPALPAGAPRDLTTICLKCLAKEPAQRYAGARALAEDLERFARGEPIRARPVTAAEALWRWTRRRPLIAALVATLLCTFLAGFAGIATLWRRAEHLRAREAQARAARENAVAHLQWMEIVRQAGTDEAPRALAKIAALLRNDPRRWPAAMLAMSIVDQAASPILAGPPVRPGLPLTTPPMLSPDGEWFAAAAEDHTLRIWDTATGAEHVCLALSSSASALAVGPGPVVLAVATGDGRLVIHRSVAEPAVPLSRSGKQPISALQFSADGSHLLARTAAQLEVWETATLLSPQSFALGSEDLRGALLSVDGGRLLAWSEKHAAVWDTKSGASLLEATAAVAFRAGAISSRGLRIALIDGPYETRLWDVEKSALLRTLASPLMEVSLLAFDRDGGRLTVGGRGNSLIVYDVSSGLKVSPPMEHLYDPTVLLAAPDGRRTLSWGRDGRACLWDAFDGHSLGRPVWLEAEGLRTGGFSSDGRAFLLCTDSNPLTIGVWHFTRTLPARRRPISGARDFDSSRLSPDGRLGCVGLSPENRAYVYELASGRVLLDVPVQGEVYVHLFSPDQRRYYALTTGGFIYGWDLETRAALWPPHHEPGGIRTGAISADGTCIVAGHTDGHIRIYDALTGHLLHVLDEPGWTKTLRFAPDASGRFVSGSDRGAVHVWDVATGALRQTFQGHTADVIATAWSPDAHYLATASYDQTARVWDAATGRLIGSPLPHLAWLSHLEFSPDGRVLATACRDGTVRLWNPLTSQPFSSPLPQGATAETVRFTGDGKCFLVRDHKGFQFWDTEKAEPVSIHYPEPVSGGLGMDGESWRAILSPDGTQVFLGYSLNEAALWTIAQPRSAVPAWFPDLLETFALLSLDSTGTAHVHPGDALFQLEARIEKSSPDVYTAWAKRCLGLP